MANNFDTSVCMYLSSIIYTFYIVSFTLCLRILSSAVDFCKQFGPRLGLTEYQAISGSKTFDTLIVFLKGFFFLKKLVLKKVSRRQKLMTYYPACRVKL